MNYYVAPLEGITTALYRNILERYTRGATDTYFAPFIVPHIKRAFNAKELRELEMGNNASLHLVPQILTTSAEDFLRVADSMRKLGYGEININMGCPSPTVTSKGRGAAFLADQEKVDAFLDGVFAKDPGPVSVKTRLGVNDPEEFVALLEVFNRYPLTQLILHPRTMRELYKGMSHRDAFLQALAASHNPLCYNGDIYTSQDYDELLADCDKVCGRRPAAIMCGRGIVADPFLFNRIRCDAKPNASEYLAFLYEVQDAYMERYQDRTLALFRMKEIWGYMRRHYPNCEKRVKKLIKCNQTEEFKELEREIIEEETWV